MNFRANELSRNEDSLLQKGGIHLRPFTRKLSD